MTSLEFMKWRELCTIGEEMGYRLKLQNVKARYAVAWRGSFGPEVDEFDHLGDAELYAGIVSGKVIA